MPLERARAWRRRWRTRSRAECRTAKSTASCTGTSSPKTCSSKQPAATPRRVCDQRRPGISRECQWRFDPASRARASHVASSFAFLRAACLAGGRGCQALRFRAVRDRPTGGRRGGHARHEGRAQRVEAQPESNPELARCWASRHFAEHRARDGRGRSPPRRAEVDALGLFGLARLRCPRGSPPAGGGRRLGARTLPLFGACRLPAQVAALAHARVARPLLHVRRIVPPGCDARLVQRPLHRRVERGMRHARACRRPRHV